MTRRHQRSRNRPAQCHTETAEDRTQLHVYIVNAGDDPQPAGLVVSHEEAGSDTAVHREYQPDVVPPRSTVHAVLDVPDHGDTPVTVKARDTSDASDLELVEIQVFAP